MLAYVSEMLHQEAAENGKQRIEVCAAQIDGHVCVKNGGNVVDEERADDFLPFQGNLKHALMRIMTSL